MATTELDKGDEALKIVQALPLYKPDLNMVVLEPASMLDVSQLNVALAEVNPTDRLLSNQ